MQSTEIGKAEKTLSQFSHLFEPWEDGVLLVRLDGTIVDWNRGAQNLYGYSADTVIGKKYSFLVPSDIKDNMLEVLIKITQGEPYARYETEHMAKDDSRIQVCLNVSPVKNESDDVIAFSILVRNITEQEQEKDLFTALTQSSPIGIYIVKGGIFKYINRQFEEIIGYGINELLSTESLSYIHEEDRELVRINAIKALKSGHCQPYEYRIVAKSGQIKWILETVISIRYQGKRATLGNFMDITESKRMQDETNQANEQLTIMLNKLQEQNRQHLILTEMRDMLQACSKMEETAPIIMSSMKKLFPESQGALFLMSNSRSDLESIVIWGGFPTDPDDNIFAPDACWGLRRGRAHVVDDVTVGPVCPHLKHAPTSPYVCLPLMAKGDILGLLHLKSGSNIESLGQQQAMADLREIAALNCKREAQ
jgi:PAS domain S-box-containing protein